MGMLDTIQSGRENKPPRLMIYGSEGVGKSTSPHPPPTPSSSRPRTDSGRSTAASSRWRTAFPKSWRS